MKLSTNRRMYNSIYKTDIPPEIENYDKIISGHNLLSKYKW